MRPSPGVGDTEAWLGNNGITLQVYDNNGDVERGIYIGFETATELALFTDLLRRTYDILLVFVFEALGSTLTGDIYIQILDDWSEWPFHATKYTPEVSRSFHYKLERQRGRAE